MCFEIRFIWESEAMLNMVHNCISKSKVFLFTVCRNQHRWGGSCESILREIGMRGMFEK
jgi:hypothetical protein